MEGLKALSGSFVAELDPAEVTEVAECLLDDVPQFAQSAAVGVIRSLGQERFQAQVFDARDSGLGSIGAVAYDPLECHRPLSGCQLGQTIEHRQQHGLVGGVGRSDLDLEHHSAGVGQQVAFTAIFRAIGRVRPGMKPPEAARTEALSITPCWGSNPPRRPRRPSSRW